MSLGNLGIAGRNLLPYRSGYGASVMAGTCQFLTIGATIDWSLFAPTTTPITLIDTEVIPAGVRYFRFGQVFTRITGSGGSSVTPTAATFTLTVADAPGGTATTQTTAAIPQTASAAQVAQALYALPNVGYQNAVVTGGNGSPFLVTFAASVLGVATLTATGATIAAGSAGASAAAPGGNSRFFGPYDPAATDGRQNVNRGDCWIANRTHVAGGTFQIPLQDDYHTGECITGGKVWGAKVIATNGTASLAAGPTWASLYAATLGLDPQYT